MLTTEQLPSQSVTEQSNPHLVLAGLDIGANYPINIPTDGILESFPSKLARFHHLRGKAGRTVPSP